MLGRAAERFIRTTWASVQELAEEMYATFSRDLPIQASRIIINQAEDDQSPPLTINRGGSQDGPTISVVRGDGGTNNFGDIDIHGGNYGGTTFDFGGPGGANDYGLPGGTGAKLDLAIFTPGGGIDAGGGGGGADLSTIVFPGQEPNSIPEAKDSPFMLYGLVVSKESGSTYAVDVWAVSPTGPRAGTISVRFPMVDPNEEIPAGTPVPVMCFPGQSGNLRRVLDAVGFIAVYME